MRLQVELNNVPNMTHGYDVYVNKPNTVHGEDIVYVHARNRNQAASIAKKAGYVVRSVNMVG